MNSGIKWFMVQFCRVLSFAFGLVAPTKLNVVPLDPEVGGKIGEDDSDELICQIAALADGSVGTLGESN